MSSSYDTHIGEAWAKRHHENLLLLFYEDLKQDIHKELRKINDFIGTNLTTKQINNVSRPIFFCFGCVSENNLSRLPKLYRLAFMNDCIFKRLHLLRYFKLLVQFRIQV